MMNNLIKPGTPFGRGFTAAGIFVQAQPRSIAKRRHSLRLTEYGFV
jgi:hypothetical protein